MERLKIGLFIDTYFPMVDGVIIVVHNYALRLSQYADVTVFAPKAREKNFNIDLPYRLVRCSRLRVPFTDYDLGIPALDFKFRRILRKSNLDIVHIHSPFEIGKIGVKYAKKQHVPIVASLHSQYKKDFQERTQSKIIANIALKRLIRLFNKADYFWAVNQQVADIFVSYGLKQRPDISFNATDMIFNTDSKAVEDLRQTLKKHDDDHILLFVGRIDFIKNLAFIMRSLKILNDKKFPFQMVFIGSGPHVKALQRQAGKAGISARVRFEGRITDRDKLAQYYQAADLFVFPSTYDTNSLVQIEAASQKTPSIFIENSATAAMIKNNVNGFITKEDENAFAEKIIAIFANENQYRAVCENAYKDVYHTWDDVVNKAYEKYLIITKSGRDH